MRAGAYEVDEDEVIFVEDDEQLPEDSPQHSIAFYRGKFWQRASITWFPRVWGPTNPVAEDDEPWDDEDEELWDDEDEELWEEL